MTFTIGKMKITLSPRVVALIKHDVALFVSTLVAAGALDQDHWTRASLIAVVVTAVKLLVRKAVDVPPKQEQVAEVVDPGVPDPEPEPEPEPEPDVKVAAKRTAAAKRPPKKTPTKRSRAKK